jgi:hypothetical protein
MHANEVSVASKASPRSCLVVEIRLARMFDAEEPLEAHAGTKLDLGVFYLGLEEFGQNLRCGLREWSRARDSQTPIS